MDLSVSWMVGDRWKDMEAGRAAGCRTVFIHRGYEETIYRFMAAPYMAVGELVDAVPYILEAFREAVMV